MQHTFCIKKKKENQLVLLVVENMELINQHKYVQNILNNKTLKQIL